MKLEKLEVEYKEKCDELIKNKGKKTSNEPKAVKYRETWRNKEERRKKKGQVCEKCKEVNF